MSLEYGLVERLESPMRDSRNGYSIRKPSFQAMTWIGARLAAKYSASATAATI
jgi:hypothetical protein